MGNNREDYEDEDFNPRKGEIIIESRVKQKHTGIESLKEEQYKKADIFVSLGTANEEQFLEIAGLYYPTLADDNTPSESKINHYCGDNNCVWQKTGAVGFINSSEIPEEEDKGEIEITHEPSEELLSP